MDDIRDNSRGLVVYSSAGLIEDVQAGFSNLLDKLLSGIFIVIAIGAGIYIILKK